MKISAIIELAYQEGGIKAIGVEPTAAEYQYALVRLNSFLRGLFGTKISTNFNDWIINPASTIKAPIQSNNVSLGTMDSYDDVYQLGNDFNVVSNRNFLVPLDSRIMCAIKEDTTVYLGNSPYDGARLAYAPMGQEATLYINGNGRLIEGVQEVYISNLGDTSPRQWFYRADLGEWIGIKDLTLTDDSILPPEFDDLLVCALAIRLTAVNGTDPRAGTTTPYNEYMTLLLSRYHSRQQTPAGGQDVRNTLQTTNNTSYTPF